MWGGLILKQFNCQDLSFVLSFVLPQHCSVLYECVSEWGNVTCSVKALWVVRLTRKALYKYSPFTKVIFLLVCGCIVIWNAYSSRPVVNFALWTLWQVFSSVDRKICFYFSIFHFWRPHLGYRKDFFFFTHAYNVHALSTFSFFFFLATYKANFLHNCQLSLAICLCLFKPTIKSTE